MKKAKKTVKKKVEAPDDVGLGLTLLSEIRDELRGIRSELQRTNTTELEASVGRLGQRIGEFIEHQFHSVK